MALALSEALQDLMDCAVWLSCGPTQHPHASDTLVLVPPMVLLRQAWTAVLKLLVRFSHMVMKVVFGCGKLAGLHEALTLSSQSNSVLVRFWSCMAPELL